MEKKGKFTAHERAFHRVDVRAELDKLEQSLTDLKIEYEQYFSGLLPLEPSRQHNEVKRKIRELRKTPLKSNALSYRLRTLEGRYSTFNTYWQRILREREDGTYFKDVFKANLREKASLQEARASTSVGKAEKSVQALFHSYKDTLEKNTGRKQDLDFNSFQKTLVERAKEFKKNNQGKKLTFKVVVKDGKVTVQARAKESDKASD